MANLVFINRFFHPDTSATSQMLSDLVFGLAERGHAVSVITSRLSYADDSVSFPATETINGVRVVRIWTTRFGRARLIGRALDYLTFYLSVVLSILRHVRRGDIVVTKTDPPMLGVVTLPFIRVKRARAINWLQDIFPEVAEAVLDQKNAPAKLVFGLLRRIRDASLRRCDGCVAIGSKMAAKLIDRGVRPDKITISPNWADESVIRPIAAEANTLRPAWGLADAFVVAYSGNLGFAHDYRTFLDAMTALEAAVPAGRPVRWLFVGGGVGARRLQEDVTRRGLTCVQFRPYQPMARLAESLSVGDVHLVSLRPELEGLIVPSKIYGIAAAGRAAIFLGAADGEVAAMLASDQSGVTVAQGDSAGLVAAITMLAADRSKTDLMGQKARLAYDRAYTRGHAVGRWDALIADLTVDHNASKV